MRQDAQARLRWNLDQIKRLEDLVSRIDRYNLLKQDTRRTVREEVREKISLIIEEIKADLEYLDLL